METNKLNNVAKTYFNGCARANFTVEYKYSVFVLFHSVCFV